MELAVNKNPQKEKVWDDNFTRYHPEFPFEATKKLAC